MRSSYHADRGDFVQDRMLVGQGTSRSMWRSRFQGTADVELESINGRKEEGNNLEKLYFRNLWILVACDFEYWREGWESKCLSETSETRRFANGRWSAFPM